MTTFYVYRAKLARVVDGDTLRLSMDLGFRIYHEVIVRMARIDAQARATEKGKQAAIWLQGRLEGMPSITVRTLKDRVDQYGRYLAELNDPANGMSINDELLATGLVEAWPPK